MGGPLVGDLIAAGVFIFGIGVLLGIGISYAFM